MMLFEDKCQRRGWNLVNMRILSRTATGRERALGRDAWDVCAEKVSSQEGDIFLSLRLVFSIETERGPIKSRVTDW